MIHIVKKYLEKSRYSNQKENFGEFFLSHPNYPSVFAVTDSLDMLGVENVAIKVPKEQFMELPESFLAVFNRDMVLVSKSDTSITIETEDGTKKNITLDTFLAGWDGVVIAIEPNDKTEDKSKSTNTKWIQYSLPVIALIVMALFYNKYSFNDIALFLISFAGIIISVFIVQEKLGFKNEIVAKFCNINPNTSCEAVIKSKTNNSNQWVDFSDLPLLFFSVGALSIILQPNHSGIIVGTLSLLAIPVVLYSIWLQKFKLKKWCVLCLAVSFLMVLQGLTFWFTTQSFPNILTINFFGFLFSLVLFSSIWLLVKPILQEKIKALGDVNGLKKFKRNYLVFNFLTQDIPVLNGFDKLEGLHFGNKNAEVQLTLILSPTCGHCHKAFEDAFKLTAKFPERVFLQVLFNINPENENNDYKIVVESLLTINNLMPEKTAEAIADWHIQKMELKEWKKKWGVSFVDMKANHQIHQQYNWCLENEFNYTPVKIINDKLFPNEYEISELKYFLNDFLEEKEVLKEIV